MFPIYRSTGLQAWEVVHLLPAQVKVFLDHQQCNGLFHLLIEKLLYIPVGVGNDGLCLFRVILVIAYFFRQVRVVIGQFLHSDNRAPVSLP